VRLLKNPKIIDNIIKNHAFRKLGRSILEKTSLLGFFFDLISWRRNMWSERKLISIYNREYVSNHGYNTEEDYRIKEAHAREIIRLLNPRKVLRYRPKLCVNSLVIKIIRAYPPTNK